MESNDLFIIVIGAVFTFVSLYFAKKGEVPVKSMGEIHTISRKDKPALFWLVVGIAGAVGAAFLLTGLAKLFA